MIPEYINNWLIIIEQMNNDNTYKLAWGRAIIECICSKQFLFENGKAIIEFDNISEKMLKYYWNQIFFFHLKQSPYKSKDPVICKDTEKLINIYKKENNSSIPTWFSKAYHMLIKNHRKDITQIINHISKTLHENVCWRFKNFQSKTIEIYKYDKSLGSRIYFESENVKLIEEYGVILSKLLNYKWAQLLEKFNYAPKIASKVNGISEAKINRNSLVAYKDELLKENNGVALDFYSGKKIVKEDISIDHVIPWSFMYSDDIWNLVITSKSNNSIKSNSIPPKSIIEKLKERNVRLVNTLDGKMHDELELAIKNGYVDKFYFDCRM